MNIDHSLHCLVDEDFQLRLSQDTIKVLTNVETDQQWTVINNIPKVIQAYHVMGTVMFIILTVEGQLLIINIDHPEGKIMELPIVIKRIHLWINIKIRDELLMMTHDDKLYRISVDDIHCVTGYIDPILISDDVTAILTRHNDYITWITDNDNDDDILHVWNGINTFDVKIPFQLDHIVGEFLISNDNTIYKIDCDYSKYRNGALTEISFTKIFKTDYNVKHIGFYPDPHYDIITIDEDGQAYQYDYHSNRRMIQYDTIKRFIRDCHNQYYAEDKNGGVLSHGYLRNVVTGFKILDVDEYYRLRIKSAMG